MLKKFTRIPFSILLLFILTSLFLGCMILGGNKIKEHRDKCYKFDYSNFCINLNCKNVEYQVTLIKIISIDSVSKKYKELILKDSVIRNTNKYQLNLSATNKEKLQNNFIEIQLMTERNKTWYSASISPSDWKTNKNKGVFFIKNVW